MIHLGSLVKDCYTGFEGVATGRTEWLYGCARIGIEPRQLHDGKPVETQWFDEQRVIVVTERAPTVSADSEATKGGPKDDPSSSHRNGG